MSTLSKSKKQPVTANIVRLCVDGWIHRSDEQTDNFSNARTLLNRAIRKSWPKGHRKAKFTVLPGGFIFDKFPEELGDIDRGWNSHSKDFNELCAYGEECIKQLLTEEILVDIAERTKYLTLGVDFKHLTDDKIGKKAIKRTHIELVAVLRLTRTRTTTVAWTGKSYPTGEQEHSLVHVVDVGTHCVEVDGLRVLVLGCHDLNMFSTRAWANQLKGSERRLRCAKMRRVAKQFDPTIVIQHPHQTDSPRIWQAAWSGVKKSLPSVEQGLSGIAYYPRPDCRETRRELRDVLKGTKFGPRIENVVIKGYD